MSRFTILLLISILSFNAFGDDDPRPEDTAFAYGSENLPVGCVEFWESILKLPAAEIAQGKRETYPSTGTCREVPPAFTWFHEQYLEHCEPAYAPSLPTRTALYHCGGRTIQYRIALRAWKHRDGKNLERLPQTEAWELLIHLLGYYEGKGADTQRQRALEIARRFSASEPLNMEAAYLHLNALVSIGDQKITEKEKKEEVQKISTRIATLMQTKEWYPNEKLNAIGISYLESAYYAMGKIGEAKAMRELLSKHPSTQSAFYYFEACAQVGEKRKALLKLAAKDSKRNQYGQYLSRDPAYQCGSTPPQMFNPSMHFALAIGVEIPSDI